MANTVAFRSFGAKLKRGDGGSPETFQEIIGCGDIEGPDVKVSFEESTNHASAVVSGGFMEWIPSLKDGESVKCPVNWNPADPVHQGLQADFDSSRLVNFQEVFPTIPQATVAFSGYIESFRFKAPVKGLTQRELQIKVTGAVTITTS